MARPNLIKLAIWLLLTAAVSAQGDADTKARQYADVDTGITFYGHVLPTGYRFGIVMPKQPTTDFIAQLVSPLTDGAGWGGVGFQSSMTGPLLLATWPNGDKVMTAPRIAKDYTLSSVVPYTANPINLQPIQQGTFVNRTHVSSTFLCGGCINSDSFDPTPEPKSSNNRLLFFGYAYSPKAVKEPSNPDTILSSHIPEAVGEKAPSDAARTVLSNRTSTTTTTAGYGAFGVVLADAESDKYEQYAALAAGPGLLGVAPEGSPPSPAQTATAPGSSSSPTSSSTPSSAAAAAPDQGVAGIEAAPTDPDFGYRQMSPFGIMALVVLGLVYLGQAFLPS